MNRRDFIQPLVKGKTVLDIGCAGIGGSCLEKAESAWVHGFMGQHAKKVVGIDIDKSEVSMLCKLGYDIRVADAQNFDLKAKFDVVHASHTMEHLHNIGNFLQCCRKHMHKESILIIAVPNAACFSRQVATLLDMEKYLRNEFHVTAWDKYTVESLMKRNGFSIEKLCDVTFEDSKTGANLFGKLADILDSHVPNMRKELVCIAKIR